MTFVTSRPFADPEAARSCQADRRFIATFAASRATAVRRPNVVLPRRAALNSFCAIRFLKEWSPPCGSDLQASSKATSRLAAVRSSRCFIAFLRKPPERTIANHLVAGNRGQVSGFELRA
jgi:hypothetical protein